MFDRNRIREVLSDLRYENGQSFVIKAVMPNREKINIIVSCLGVVYVTVISNHHIIRRRQFETMHKAKWYIEQLLGNLKPEKIWIEKITI